MIIKIFFKKTLKLQKAKIKINKVMIKIAKMVHQTSKNLSIFQLNRKLIHLLTSKIIKNLCQ
jgi:hypothetical protein